MHNVVIRTVTLSAASTLHARRRRANDNIGDVPMAAGAEICGAFTPVTFGDATVVHASRNPGMPTVLRSITRDGEPLVSNANPPALEGAQTASALGGVTRLWAALWREWTIRRAVSKLESMGDWQLSDIGVQRGDIDFIVRFGRSTETGPEAER